MNAATRQTADERREDLLRVAQEVFSRRGLHGSSTEEIAETAGISQPYLFRLFGTKKKLFLATVERCLADTLELFRAAAGDLRGEEALDAMGDAYVAMVLNDRTRLLDADAGLRELRRPRRSRHDAGGLRQAPPLRRDGVRQAAGGGLALVRGWASS